ncbi:uncharacterized protein EMH_0067450 [Eimeria mitis]|uniref:Uncharacterized protein n=1 Tax=Eimeria mitis TaxID=44415 RepID=U6JPQ7_9EIME|nr:uncharacterized protein EMH_0067450 [Eimeria mitis]CDJ26846.1 hypothetical protein, conserved [Eimeria mitis]
MFIARNATAVCGGVPGSTRTRIPFAVIPQRLQQHTQQKQEQQQLKTRHSFAPPVGFASGGCLQQFPFDCFPLQLPGLTSLCGSVRWLTFHPQRRVVGHRLEIMAGKHRKRRLVPPKVPLHPSAAAAAAAAERAAPGVTTPAAPQQDMTLFETYRDLQLRWKRTTRQSRKKFCIARKWRQHLACQPQPEPSWLLFLHPQMGPPAGRAEAHGGPPKHRRIGRRRSAAPELHACDSSANELQQHAQQSSAPHRQERPTQEEQQQHLQAKEDLNQQRHPQQEQQQEQQVQQQAAADYVGAFQRIQGTHGERPPFRLSYDPKEIFCVFKSSVSAQHKAR